MSNLASKLGQIGPKWDKSGTFEDQFQYSLARDEFSALAESMCTETDLKKS